MFVDFIINGQGHGAVAERLQEVRYDPHLMRPYIDEDGTPCCTINTGRRQRNAETNRMEPVLEVYTIRELRDMGIESPVFNAATLRKDEWIQLDRVVQESYLERLRAWTDLQAAASFGGFDAMSKMVLEHETMNKPGIALMDMDGDRDGQADTPLFQLEGMPLPLVYSSFSYSKRRLMASRNSGTPLDTVMGRFAGRAVAEVIERVTIGTLAGMTYGASTRYSRASTVYGYTTFPDRLLKTDLTVPTGLNPQATVDDVLEMREQLYDAKRFGPYMIYHSTDWDRYLDNDYAFTAGATYGVNPNKTLRNRLREIDGIMDVRRLDFLTSDNDPFTLIMVQMTEDVCRAIDGMGLSTVQWESMGGARINFRSMAIQVPQMRSDYDGNCGILQATTA